MQADPTLLRDWIDRAARRDPGKPWIVLAEGGRTVTYGELRQAIGRIAAFLRSRGLGANDRVALLATNSIEHLVCYFGVMAYGATICTVHVEMNRNQLGNIFTRLKPALVLQQDGLGLEGLLAGVTAPAAPPVPLDNLPNLRFITSSSAPLTIEEWRRFEERFGIPIAQAYGSSESGWIAALPGEARRLGTVGRPFAYHDLAIVDTAGQRLPPGEIG